MVDKLKRAFLTVLSSGVFWTLSEAAALEYATKMNSNSLEIKIMLILLTIYFVEKKIFILMCQGRGWGLKL